MISLNDSTPKLVTLHCVCIALNVCTYMYVDKYVPVLCVGGGLPLAQSIALPAILAIATNY